MAKRQHAVFSIPKDIAVLQKLLEADAWHLVVYEDGKPCVVLHLPTSAGHDLLRTQGVWPVASVGRKFQGDRITSAKRALEAADEAGEIIKLVPKRSKRAD